MSNKKLVVYIYAILALSSIVLADFYIYTDKYSMSICQRDTQLFIDRVFNSGDDAEFNINYVGSAYTWATSVPVSLFLTKNSEGLIYSYITPKLTTNAGAYNLNIVVTSNGISKTITHNITVNDCHTIYTALNEQKSICPGELAKYEFLVNNTGGYQETYNISAKSAINEWITLSDTILTLSNGTSKTVYAYVRPKQDARDGTYEFDVAATALTSNALSSSSSSVYVKPCYNYNINVDNANLNFCEHTRQAVPFIIANKGTSSNTYTLSISGPMWASLDRYNVELKSGESARLNVMLSPDYGVKGDFDINVKAVPDNGATGTFAVKAHVRKCNSVAVDIAKKEDKICNTLENSYDVAVTNDGELTKTYRLELDAPNWVNITRELFTLNANETRYFKLDAKPWLEVKPDSYIIKVRAVAQDESKVSAEDSIKLTTVSKNNCYLPEITPEKTDVSVYYDASTTIPVSITNKGYQTADYGLGLSDSAASFTQLNPSIINLYAGSSKVVYLYIAPSEKVAIGNYKLTITTRLADSSILASKTINVNVIDTKQMPIWERIKRFISGIFGNAQIKQFNENETIKTNTSKLFFMQKQTTSNATAVPLISLSDYGSVLSSIWAYKNYILAGIAVLLLIIIILVIRRKRKRR